MPIARKENSIIERCISANGQPSTTHYEVIKEFNGYSLVKCILETGRTHQIRVHLAYKHYPILNDQLYGVESPLCIRMGLMADELEFYHPLKQEMMIVETDLPNDLGKLYYEVIK